MQQQDTPSEEKNQQLPNVQPHDVVVSVPLHQRSYHHPDAYISFRRRDDGWRRRVARARRLR
jgi:hypothetical protein